MHSWSEPQGHRHAVGPVHPRFPQIRRIAVLRGGGLGDLMFAIPALHALKAAYPGASLTLLGTQMHARLLSERPGPVDRVEVLPPCRGVQEGPEDPETVARFQARMRDESFDLAVQLHGGGRYSNPFLLQLGARHTVGTGTPDAARLERMVDYRYYQHEVLRSLEVVGLAGAATSTVGPVVAVTDADRTASAAVAGPPAEGRPRLAIHPGATDPRRRWPVERFAAVAAQAADAGYEVLVIGDASEAELGQAVLEEASPLGPGRGSIRSLAGQLGLGALAGLLESCDVMLGNDSGPRHLAQAVGTPTAGIYWVGNAIMAAPLGRSTHRVQIGWTTRCPSCGADVTQVGWTAPHCGHEFSLTEAVEPAEVFRDVVDLTATSPRLRGR